MTAQLSWLYPFIKCAMVVFLEKKNMFVNMNGKNSILLVDPEFDVKSVHNCDLLIKVTQDNFSYAILEGSENRVVVLYDQQECKNVVGALSYVLSDDPYLAIPFKTVKASVYTRNTIAIPNDLLDAENLNVYAKFFSVEQSEQLHLQNVGGQNFTSIFNLDHDMEELLITKFGISKIYDHAAPLLALSSLHSEKHLILDFTVGSFSGLLTEGGKLIFENCYEVEDAGEFNYYLLLMIQQLKIDTQATKVYISGIIHQGDERFEIINQYFAEMEFITPEAEQLNSEILDDMPVQYYSTLLALKSCE
jgi:hypothetical protein